MANPEHVEILRKGVKSWNERRRKKTIIKPDLSGANLRKIELTNANLKRVTLKGADLKGANLQGANLSEANLEGADLSGANLKRANLRYADLRRANLKGVNLEGANLKDVDFSEMNLEGANLSEANLEGADLKWANLKRANLSNANLKGVYLIAWANLEGANLSNLNLQKKYLRGANLKGANLEGANLQVANLEGANLKGAKLKGAKLKGVDFSGVNLEGANLSEANLEGADLSEANLKRANLRYANLRRANLFGAYLKGANLSDLDLEEANLCMADISEANLYRTMFPHEGTPKGVASFLDLGTCIGLETARFSEPDFLLNYLTRAFEYAYMPNIPESKWPEFIPSTTKKIRILLSLYSDKPAPQQLIEVIDVLATELIKYLKKHPKALYQVKPRQFEELIAEILASYGWDVQLTPPIKDGGYDIFAISRDDLAEVETSWIIECKKYASENKVGVDIVRALYGVKSNLKVANALLATTSFFTKGATAFKASRYDIQFKDYPSILEWINQYRPNPNGSLYIKDNKLILPNED